MTEEMTELDNLMHSRLMLIQVRNFMRRENMLDELNACGNKKCPLLARHARSETEITTAIKCVEAQIRQLDPECDALRS